MNNHVFQEHEAYCGPAVAQMVLKRFGTELTQQEIAKELETDMVVGTSARELVSFFERRGFQVSRKNGAQWKDVEQALATSPVVIVEYLELEEDIAHYTLVSTLREDAIVLNDPLFGAEYVLPKEIFLKRWLDDADKLCGDQLLLTVASPARS